MAKKSAAQNSSKKTKTTKIDQIVNSNPELKMAIDQIEKQFGTGSIMALGTESSPKFDGISTGSLSLDIALGGCGIPKGRIIEIFGPESSGKTTLTLHVVAQAQKAGGIAAFIDAEHALDPSWAKRLGVPERGARAHCRSSTRNNTLFSICPKQNCRSLDLLEKNAYRNYKLNMFICQEGLRMH